jgi:ribonuclease J
MTKEIINKDDLVFVPLGGSGEIGMNLNLYGLDGKWLMVDLGMTFAGDYFPGVDLMLPDPSFIEDRADDLLAIILTHGHEDHIGAVPYLLENLRAPIFATAFTAELVRGKLREAGLLNEATINIIDLGGQIKLGPFDLSYVALAHSIAEGNALKISTRHGTIFHTGDWKLDANPVIGKPSSAEDLSAIGDAGVLAMVGDSTNVFNREASGSESDVYAGLRDIVASQKGRVVVTTFASNIARLSTIGRIALETGRSLALLGRSMRRVVEAAKATGYLHDFPPIIDEDELADTPRDKLLVLCTGCQGEGRAALSRLADDGFRSLSLSSGDCVVFSSKIIPGNDLAIARLVNRLVLRDIHVVTEKDAFIHVSGHPGQAELADMYGWIKPQIAVPVHGEPRHLKRHGEFARACGTKEIIVPKNGDVIRLAPGGAAITGEVESGYLLVDGNELIAIDDQIMAERRRIALHGQLTVALAVDAKGVLRGTPQLIPYGIPGWYEDDQLKDMVFEAIDDVLRQLHPKNLLDDRLIEEEIRRITRRRLFKEIGKKAIIAVRVIRTE